MFHEYAIFIKQKKRQSTFVEKVKRDSVQDTPCLKQNFKFDKTSQKNANFDSKKRSTDSHFEKTEPKPRLDLN